MAATIDELRIQTRHTLCTLHKILVVLLKFVVKNHKIAIANGDKDLEEILSNIVKKHFDEFKKTPLYKQENYKKYFGDLDPYTKAFTVKANIHINKLDVSSLCLLIPKDFIFKDTQNISRCCQNCKHEELESFNFTECKGCNKKCKMMHIKIFCKLVKCFRDCFAHDNDAVYESLVAGKGGLNEFCQKNWEELWRFAWNKTSDCMNSIRYVEDNHKVAEEKKLISEETFKDFEMKIRLAKHSKDIHSLLPKDKEVFIEHFNQIILGEADHYILLKDCLKIFKKQGI